MDQAVLAEYVLTGAILATWLGDKIISHYHNKLDRVQLAELIHKISKHFDDKIDDIKEDIKEDLEEVEELIEEKMDGR